VLDGFEAIITCMSLLLGFGYLAASERVFWAALAVLAVALVIAMALPSNPASFVNTLRKRQATVRTP
jgi:hypothetical protein